MSFCACNISFKSVQICGCCCKMFRGLTSSGTQCTHYLVKVRWRGGAVTLAIPFSVVSARPQRTKPMLHVQCESKKSPPKVFWHFPPNGWEFLDQILHTYYTFHSMLDILSNCLQFWRSYAIFSATTQLTPHVQNVYHRPKHTLAFSDIFPKQLGIFGPNFTYLLHVPIYASLQVFIQLSLTVKLCHSLLSATTQRAFQPMVDILSIIMVVALNMT